MKRIEKIPHDEIEKVRDEQVRKIAHRVNELIYTVNALISIDPSLDDRVKFREDLRNQNE